MDDWIIIGDNQHNNNHYFHKKSEIRHSHSIHSDPNDIMERAEKNMLTNTEENNTMCVFDIAALFKHMNILYYTCIDYMYIISNKITRYATYVHNLSK